MDIMLLFFDQEPTAVDIYYVLSMEMATLRSLIQMAFELPLKLDLKKYGYIQNVGWQSCLILLIKKKSSLYDKKFLFQWKMHYLFILKL